MDVVAYQPSDSRLNMGPEAGQTGVDAAGGSLARTESSLKRLREVEGLPRWDRNAHVQMDRSAHALHQGWICPESALHQGWISAHPSRVEAPPPAASPAGGRAGDEPCPADL
jgi:hypothetical protein